jgi:DNA-binding CsgD family transcriptional regulator
LQHALYRAAKADPGRRFHALYDKVCRSDVLWRAWVAVRANNGAPGIDKVTLAQVEEYGVARLLGELASELREGRYRPLPARRVLIPKPGTTEQRAAVDSSGSRPDRAGRGEDRILERQREGIAAARQRGAYTGRKPALTAGQARELRERAATGERKSALAAEFGISRETVYSYLRTASATGAAS